MRFMKSVKRAIPGLRSESGELERWSSSGPGSGCRLDPVCELVQGEDGKAAPIWVRTPFREPAAGAPAACTPSAHRREFQLSYQ